MNRSDYNTPFRSPELEDVRRGTVSLGVPTHEDILQIRADRIDGKARIIVHKTRSQISVAREDGSPIQVHIHPNEDTYTPQGHSGDLIKPVFLDPVKELILGYDRKAHLWTPAGEDVESLHVQRITEFAKIIGQYALKRQIKNSRLLSFKSKWLDAYEL